MAVSHHLKPGVSGRMRIRIATVDPSTRRVEGIMKDGSTLQIAVWDIAPAFRWPVVGEIWVVSRVSGHWMLDSRIQQGQVVTTGTSAQVPTQLQPEPAPIENMAQGEMKLDSAMVIDSNGNTFVAVDLTGIEDGYTLKWDATSKTFVATA